jgi:hypothetical protein
MESTAGDLGASQNARNRPHADCAGPRSAMDSHQAAI